jgi:hypothetical protein
VMSSGSEAQTVHFGFERHGPYHARKKAPVSARPLPNKANRRHIDYSPGSPLECWIVRVFDPENVTSNKCGDFIKSRSA